MIRSFISVELPPKIKNELKRLLEHFKGLAGKISWVRPEGIHITLKFLGDIPESQVEPIKEKLEGLAAVYRAFPLGITDMGAFPNTTYPRVIWVGLQDESEALLKIQNHLDSELQDLGFSPEERSFSPHITLGRVKSLQSKGEFLRKIHTLPDLSEKSFMADRIHLMKSQLSPAGAIYTELASINLRK